MTVGAQALPALQRRGALARSWAFARRHLLTVYALLAFAYLLVPIGVVIAFSFNDPAGRFNFTWQGFTLDNWKNWDGVPGLRAAITLSVEIALIAALVATVLGTLIALALVRYRFRGRGATNLLIFLPMSTPEIVLGASLLTLFINRHVTNVIQLGFWTIVIAHVMFCISYVVVTVKARLIGFDRHLEEAAMDLGAFEVATFRLVTLPLSLPGVVAGTLLTFIPATGDFINAQLLGTPQQAMIGNVIQSKFFNLLDYPGAAALSFTLMAAVLILIAVYARVIGTEKLTG